MATRFYLPSSGAAAVSPAYDGAWEDTTGVPATRLRCVVARVESLLDGLPFFSPPGDYDDKDILFRQYVSDPIVAQTLTAQTLKFQLQATEGALFHNGYTDIGIRVVSNDGTTVRGTVLAVTRDDLEVYVPGYQNRQFSATTTQVVAEANDRIVIEVGVGGQPTSSGGRLYAIVVGDDSPTDLPEDDSELSSYNPWVEFTQDLTFTGPQTYSRTLLETLTPVAIMSPYRTSIRTLTDLLDVSGVLNRGRFLELSDNLDLSDSFTRIITRVLELLDTLDVTVTHLGYPRFQQPEDLINLIEAFSIGRLQDRTLSDTLTLSDSMLASVGHLLLDLLTISDTITKSTSAGRAEVLVLSEVIAKGTYEGLADTIALYDGPSNGGTLNLQVSADSDDIRHTSAHDINQVGLVFGVVAATGQEAGLRFTNVQVPQGASILVAYITHKARSTRSNQAIDQDIRGADHDDAPTFAGTDGDWHARGLTTAKVDWLGTESWTLDQEYNSPDITAIIQEIVSRPGWQPGNAIMLFSLESLNEPDGNYQEAYQHESEPTKTSKLHIEFEPGGGVTKATTKFLADALTLLGALQKAIAAILPAETLTVTDATSMQRHGLGLSDTLILADSITKAATHFLADILSLQDVLLGVPRPVLELQVRMRGHLTIQQSFRTHRTIRIQFRGGGEE